MGSIDISNVNWHLNWHVKSHGESARKKNSSPFKLCEKHHKYHKYLDPSPLDVHAAMAFIDLEARASRNTAHFWDLTVNPNMVIAAKGTCSSLQVPIKFCYFTRNPQLAVFMGANGDIVTLITYVVFMIDKSQVPTRHCAEGKASRVRYAQPHRRSFWLPSGLWSTNIATTMENHGKSWLVNYGKSPFWEANHDKPTTNQRTMFPPFSIAMLLQNTRR